MIHLEAPSKALAPPPSLGPCLLPGSFWSQTRRNAQGKEGVTRTLRSRGVPENGEEAPETQCYKNGLVVGGLEANGLGEDPVWKENKMKLFD